MRSTNLCTRSALLLAALVWLAPSNPLEAQSRGRDKARDREEAPVQVDLVVFSSVEREAITAHFLNHPTGRVKPLPPGIRKNLARGKPLPPGIAKQVLPDPLSAGLPLREGYQRIQVGADVMLVEVATGMIHDILMDVIR